MGSFVYVLDSSSLIQASRIYYPFDIVPVFWRSLIEHTEKGRLGSIDRVKAELRRGNDHLANWASMEFGRAFVSTDREDVILHYAEVMRWVNIQTQYSNEAKARFADGADAWLIAYAMATGSVVVTQEGKSPDAKNRVPIPNVCEVFNVRSIDTFQMLRELRVQFT